MRDTVFPGLGRQLIAPNQFTTLAHYDARGNVDVVTAINPYGDGRNATTTIAWDPHWDKPTRTTLPDGTESTSLYDP